MKKQERPNIIKCLLTPAKIVFRNPLVLIPPALLGVVAALVLMNTEPLPPSVLPLFASDKMLLDCTNRALPWVLVALMLPLFTVCGVAPSKLYVYENKVGPIRVMREVLALALSAYRVFQVLTLHLFPILLFMLAGFAFLGFLNLYRFPVDGQLWPRLSILVVLGLLMGVSLLRVLVSAALSLGGGTDGEYVHQDSNAIMSRGLVSLLVLLLTSSLLGYLLTHFLTTSSPELMPIVFACPSAAALWYCIASVSAYTFMYSELLRKSRAETVRRLSSSSNLKRLVRELAQEDPTARAILQSESNRATVRISREQANSMTPSAGKKKEVPGWTN